MRVKHLTLTFFIIYIIVSFIGGYVLDWFEPFCDPCAGFVDVVGGLGIMFGYVLVALSFVLGIAMNWDKKIF